MGRSILIAGGGIGGLVAALCLNRAGHDVTVFETVSEPRELGVGINLLPHSVRVLHDLGLESDLAASAVATSELRFCSDDGVLIWSEPRGLAAGNPWPQYSIHRGRLQMVLLDAVRRTLGPDRILTGHHLDGFDQDKDGVLARFVDRRSGVLVGEYEGEALVGCDGLHSALRRSFVSDEGPPRYSGLVLWRGAVEAPPFLDGRTMFMAGHDRQKAVVYPIRGPVEPGGTVLTNWVAERPVDVDVATADWNAAVDPADIAPWFADWDFGWIHVGELLASTEVAYEFPMVDRDPLERWSCGRATLLGDAAHPMRPNGSNGASQAILDGEALAVALSADVGVAAALESYEADRREPTSRLVLANRQAGPERVMQWVEERCDRSCRDRHTCVPTGELEREANAYKELAGFDLATLQALSHDRTPT
ncbi:MAG: flavin-dependent oxidoreductase [Actinobacteria bacterium]|nr:flavin-dependent oxidoreductase [Actinomycetota bacterium]